MADPEKVIVAIHGIGSQRRSDTIRAVARRFGDSASPPMPMQSLGHFHFDKHGEVQVTDLDLSGQFNVEKVRLVEVFWADIPRQVVDTEDTLEETKAWGESVASRAYGMYRSKNPGAKLKQEDFTFGANVVSDIVETVGVLERLSTIVDKLGLFRFDLAPILRDYIGDVQLVTEFKYYRRRILSLFHQTMNAVVEKIEDGTPEIHIVAHSEGTVISFLALLEGLSGLVAVDPDDSDNEIGTDWVKHVRGFMTIGSPIDKHIVLWPKLWDAFRPPPDEKAPPPDERIRWRNYYDYGDPIGFKLDTARDYLERSGFASRFEFSGPERSDEQNHDYGFSRYWLPGKAHVDYWGDRTIFEHFFHHVVGVQRLAPSEPPKPPEPPKNKPLCGVISASVPYALSAALHLFAMFFLSKGVTNFLHGDDAKVSTVALIALGSLWMGMSFAARIPCLVKSYGLRWNLLSVLLFLVAALPTYFLLPAKVAQALLEYVPAPAQSAVVVAAAGLVAVVSWLPSDPRTGRRVLLCAGSLLLVVVLGGIVYRAPELLANAFWPLVLGALAFSYCWWLAVLVFDLAFIWHRYIRESVAVDTLAAWYRGEDARPRTMDYIRETCGMPRRGSTRPPAQTTAA